MGIFTLSKFKYLIFLFAGLLLPLGFAPFHLPGAAILGLSLFFYGLMSQSFHASFLHGLIFGLGYFGFGVSWLYISIHNYGHLNWLISALITFLFVFYLALFPALLAWVVRVSHLPERPLLSCCLVSALWVASEYLRSTCFSGFPWLLIGFGQYDTFFKSLLPLIGVYGLSFFTCMIASLIASLFLLPHKKPLLLGLSFLLLLAPLSLKAYRWTSVSSDAPLSVAVIQANLSMRDKWDESLFWQLLERYAQGIHTLLGTDLIVLPESAIPLPGSYVSDYLEQFDNDAKRNGSAILLGIPEPSAQHSDSFYNALLGLGHAKGVYRKKHLVPFGEYIPSFLQFINKWLSLPDTNLQSGPPRQSFVTVHHHPIASLICYELAYGNLLREQLPKAQWIVSISDDGWFGHSLAVYQQQQMAQVRSLQTGRYQVLANNDGLSSLIDEEGKIIASLPVYKAGLLKSTLYPRCGQTPWVFFGDSPILFFSLFIIGISLYYRITFNKEIAEPIAANPKRRYPYQPQ